MSLQHVLALEVKHHLHGESSQEIGDLMQSLSNGELVALLKDFKVPRYHKRKKLKACEMIEEFKKHREDGYPRLKCKLMTPAQRMAAARSNETSEVNEPRLSNTTSVARPSQSATVTEPVDPVAKVAVATVTPPCTKLITFPFHPSPYESFMLNV